VGTLDITAEVTKLARTLNGVKVNGAAAVAADVAIAHGKELAEQASDLPDMFRGAAAGSVLAKNMTTDWQDVQRKADSFRAPSLAAAPVGSGWQDLRRAIERVYVDGAGVYGAADVDVSVWRALIGDLDQELVKYGSKLADAGLAAPGVLLGDVVHAVGSNAGKIAEGTGAGVADLGSGVTSIVGGVFKGLWPVLILAAVVGGVYVFGPTLLASHVGRHLRGG
jgi:hypothetical protein